MKKKSINDIRNLLRDIFSKAKKDSIAFKMNEMNKDLVKHLENDQCFLNNYPNREKYCDVFRNFEKYAMKDQTDPYGFQKIRDSFHFTLKNVFSKKAKRYNIVEDTNCIIPVTQVHFTRFLNLSENNETSNVINLETSSSSKNNETSVATNLKISSSSENNKTSSVINLETSSSSKNNEISTATNLKGSFEHHKEKTNNTNYHHSVNAQNLNINTYHQQSQNKMQQTQYHQQHYIRQPQQLYQQRPLHMQQLQLSRNSLNHQYPLQEFPVERVNKMHKKMKKMYKKMKKIYKKFKKKVLNR
jgi:hypothetical protein